VADQAVMAADFRMIFVDLAREADFELGALKVRPSVRQVEVSGAEWGGVWVGENSLNRLHTACGSRES
jgi:hypothetical protein